MKTFGKTGMRGVSFPGAVAFVVLSTHAGAALSQVQAVRATAKPRVDTIVTKQDTSKRVSGIVMLRRPSPKIDSLLAALEILQLGSPEAAKIRDSLEAAIRAESPRMSAQGGRQTFTVRIDAATTAPSKIMSQQAARDLAPRGWMGMKTNGVYVPSTEPSGIYVRYLEYPTVVEVDPNSPAGRVGMRFGDSLVAYDGRDLLTYEVNLTRLLDPGREVSVRLRRDGETKNVAIVVEKAPPQVQSERTAEAVADMYMVSRGSAPVMVIDSAERRLVETRAAVAAGGFNRTGPTRAGTPIALPGVAVAGVLGAAMTTVDTDMAESLVGMKGKTGVLVTTVPLRSPAGRTGLRNGDVIVRVEGSTVLSLPYLRFKLQQLEASRPDKIHLTILRAGKTLDLSIDTPR